MPTNVARADVENLPTRTAVLNERSATGVDHEYQITWTPLPVDGTSPKGTVPVLWWTDCPVTIDAEEGHVRLSAPGVQVGEVWYEPEQETNPDGVLKPGRFRITHD